MDCEFPEEEGSVLIVAELTNNHLGDLNRLKKMVKLAKKAGADFVKVQKRDVDTFYSKEELNRSYSFPYGNTFADYRRHVELNQDGFEFLDKVCKENQIKWFSSVLDYPSFKFIQQFSPSYIKIPSTVSNHCKHQLCGATVKEYKKNIVVSTGYTDKAYEDYVLNVFRHVSKLYILQALSAYPAPLYDCQIGVIRHYRMLRQKYPNIVPGYSSHDNGSLASMLAVAAGAKMIEKHVKLGEVDWIHFDHVALDLEAGEFNVFVEDVRKAERIVGSERKIIKSCEYHKYTVW